jgi:hypothetical protein
VALIYAFRDEAGHWHGDTDGILYEVSRPTYTTLDFYPKPGNPGAGSPFAEQTLQVASASVGEATPGRVRYLLGNGKMHYATVQVDELLFGDDLNSAWHLGSWPPITRPGPSASA